MTRIANSGNRNVVVDATGTFGISSAGIAFDPLVGGANAVEVAIYAVSPGTAPLLGVGLAGLGFARRFTTA